MGTKYSQNRKFQHYTVYAKVGQLKDNNNQVMCHLSMKLSDMFDQNLPCTSDQIREKPILMKKHSRLDFESKSQGHSKNQKTISQGAINMRSTKKY